MLKPPRSGNCSITKNDSQKPLFTISELKSVFAKPEVNDVKKEMLEKLRDLVKNEDWSIEDIVEHDYAKPELTNCLLYCLTCDLVKRIMDTEKCLACKNALLNPLDTPTLPESALTQCTSDSVSYHPNSHLYRLILHLESLFQKYCDSNNPFENILNDVIDSSHLVFPCKEHASDKLMHIIQYFTMMRMQQYCNRINHEQDKTNRAKKKAAKWCKS